MNNNNSTTTLAAAISIYQQQQSTSMEKNKLSAFLHLPPTPSSSSTTTALSYFGNNTEKFVRELPFSSQIPVSASSRGVVGANTHQKYGSLGSSSPYTESISRPITPSQTTISPNDNDEGLYLLWTQQLLRERGFKPSPCRLPDDKDGILNDTEEEEEDDDSSVSDMSSILSSEDEEEEEDQENGEEGEEEYIAEQRRLFSPASRQKPSSLYAYSQRASMISGYSSTAGGEATNNNVSLDDNDEDTLISNSSRGPVATFFHNCFSFCF